MITRRVGGLMLAYRLPTHPGLLVSLVLWALTTGQLAADPLSDPYEGLAGEFSFVRLQYDTRYSDYRFTAWTTDYPAADINFLKGVRRLTHIQINSDPIVRRLDDEDIFNYPFLYAVEMGRNGGAFFTPQEADNLREYLLRGGFLFVDDFWGSYQWALFQQAMAQAFPDREFVKLDTDHEIYRNFYDVDGPAMIPALGNTQNRPEGDIDIASNHVLLDDDGRVMVLVNWNSDIGDGWEHTYHPNYPVAYANRAYRLGINYLIYALTH